MRLGIGLGLALWALGILFEAVGESFPVEHREPITVRVLGGGSGRPQPHARLMLAAGYDQRDIEQRFWQDEVVTDEAGLVRLPQAISELPFLRVTGKHIHLCPATSMFNVERIRRDGLNAANRCGSLQVPVAPRVVVLFAKDNAVDPKTPHVGKEDGAPIPQETTIDYVPGEERPSPIELERVRPDQTQLDLTPSPPNRLPWTNESSAMNEIEMLVKRGAAEQTAVPIPDRDEDQDVDHNLAPDLGRRQGLDWDVEWEPDWEKDPVLGLNRATDGDPMGTYTSPDAYDVLCHSEP